MARRDTYDPFAPPTPPFPAARLRRARIPVAAIGHLRDRYDDLSQDQAVRFAISIRQQSDGALRHRFTLPQDLTGLATLTVPVLRDLATAQGVGISGAKDELVQRITEAATGQPSSPQGAGDDGGDQEGQGDEQPPVETPEQPPAETPAETPAEQPAQEPTETPAPQPDGTGETITVETTGEQITGQATDEPITDDNAGQVETTTPDCTPETHTGEIPASAAGDPLADTDPQPRDRADEVLPEAEPTGDQGPVVDEPTDPTAQPHAPVEAEQPTEAPTSPADVPPAVVGTPEPTNVPAVDADAALASAPAPVEPVATPTVSRSKTATSRPKSQQSS